MSRGLGIIPVLNSKNLRNVYYLVIRNFSKKSQTEDPYKYVKTKKNNKLEKSLAWKDPNFELLASNSDFPYFLPGNIGIAWFDKSSSLKSDHEFIMEEINDKDIERNITCSIQQCPTVLRKTVYDLFPNRNLKSCDLSVVTISLKPNVKSMRANKENETEKLAQTFIIAARSICDKLRKAGYWADFINPFSGKPYHAPGSLSSELYKSDEKFRCLDFKIFEIEHCKVISNEQDGSQRRFVGSLFTTAPSIQEHINDIFL